MIQSSENKNPEKPRTRSRGRRAVVVLIALAAIYLIGPRVSTDVTKGAPPAVAGMGIGELDAYLEASEARFADDLVGDTAKRIFWHDKPGSKTPVAVVFLHGFAGSHPTLAPLPQEVAGALGANLFCTRYAGHGRKDPDGFGGPLAEATLQQWVDDTREALAIGRELGERVVVIANSTAAPLASWLAGEGEAPDVLVLMSPNFGLKDPLSEFVLGPWGRQILWLSRGRTHTSACIVGDEHRRVATTVYPSSALMTLSAAIKLGREAKFEQIEIPALCLYSEDDQVISTDDLFAHFRRFKSTHKRIEEVTGCTHEERHVLAGDMMSGESTPEVRDMIVEFVRQREPRNVTTIR